MKNISKIFLILCFVTSLASPAIAANIIINPDGTLYQPVKKTFWDRFKKKKKIQTPNLDGKGYYGTLPDVKGDFEYKKETTETNPERKYTEKDIQDGLLLDAPLGDPLFLDVIIKKDKSSTYINDLVKIKETLEKLRQCITDEASIQFFNANVNILDLQTKALEKKYDTTSYAQTNSYYAVRHVNYSAKILGNLKFDANFYSRYMPLQDSIYTPQNIKAKSGELLEEIEKTIYEIGNAE